VSCSPHQTLKHGDRDQERARAGSSGAPELRREEWPSRWGGTRPPAGTSPPSWRARRTRRSSQHNENLRFRQVERQFKVLLRLQVLGGVHGAEVDVRRRHRRGHEDLRLRWIPTRRRATTWARRPRRPRRSRPRSGSSPGPRPLLRILFRTSFHS